MHILHIASDFSNTNVHSSLYKALDKMGLSQIVFNPIRVQKRETIGRNEFEAKNCKFVYADVVKPYHRYSYHLKRMAIFNALQNRIDLNKVDLVHAATLFTDGGQAYKIFQKYHIPYVVAIRNTDINGFLDKLPNTWKAGRKILCNSSVIVFISKALMDKFSNHRVVKPILPKIKDKMMLIPNGIDDFFLDNISYAPHHYGHDILYVGNFSPNKNVFRLGEAVLKLKKEEQFKDITLTLVGGGGGDDSQVQAMISTYPNVFHYLGPIYEKGKLIDIFRSHSVFAMPSITESFGLVYLEALSQNLPVLYTKGQGIDGLLEGPVGIGVDPFSIDAISYALRIMMDYPERYSNGGIPFEKFKWGNIANIYVTIYNKLLNKENTL